MLLRFMALLHKIQFCVNRIQQLIPLHNYLCLSFYLNFFLPFCYCCVFHSLSLSSPIPFVFLLPFLFPLERFFMVQDLVAKAYGNCCVEWKFDFSDKNKQQSNITIRIDKALITGIDKNFVNFGVSFIFSLSLSFSHQFLLR